MERATFRGCDPHPGPAQAGAAVHEESTVLDTDTNTPDEPTVTGGEPAAGVDGTPPADGAPGAAKKAAKKTAKKAVKKTAKKTAKRTAATAEDQAATAPSADSPADSAAAEAGPEAAAPRKKAAKKAAAKPKKTVAAEAPGTDTDATSGGAPMVLFQAPEKAAPARKRAAKKAAPAADAQASGTVEDEAPAETPVAKKTTRRPAKKAAAGPEGETADGTAPEGAEEDEATESDHGEGGEAGPRRRRRRGGRRRRRGAGETDNGEDAGSDAEDTEGDEERAESGEGGETGTRRRRTRVRTPRNPEDEITSIGGSTRLEAKKQRRREGREAGRRRAPIVSEAEFLARREAVDRVMVIRQREDLTQIAVLEDKVLVEHYVARESQTSLIGNIYLGRVQNVLPSMEAAFIDIGKGRNAVLYAGEVNWSALGHVEGQPRKVESVLKSGQTILVQVTKDPVGHKGARLTGQISLPGRFLVYVPDGNTSGISRKLPDTERNRLKTLLKEIVPDTAGVIVRTAAEGASEEELTQDVERLTARWADIETKVAAGKAPELLYGEPDLTLKVVRDLFTEDFAKLVVQGDDAWDLVDGYVSHVAPDLRERLEKYDAAEQGRDVFAAYRLDEQIAKGLDRKVWLPSGGSLIIDRTEAMTVVDVNTGKFTGSGGNLEETVTKNNLEAAEEMVRQLRLRDIGGIIVIDFIDMVLESNRDLVLRRLVECLGRDRTRHQVAEVTSLGLVQMTRKRIGTGLLEAFSEDCEHCKGRGVIVHEHPIEPSNRSVGMGGGIGGPSGGTGGEEPRSRRSRGGRGRKAAEPAAPVEPPKPSPMALAGTKPHPADEAVADNDEAVESPAVEESPVADQAPEPTQPAGTVEDQAPEPPHEPVVAAPVVVTTTRRRRAARPAGPAAATPEPAAEPATETAPEHGPETGPEQLLDPADPVEEAEVAAAAEAAEAAGSVLHVPVKKKGARKR